METKLALNVYRPKSTDEAAVVAHLRIDVAALRQRGYITSRPAPLCRTPRGEILVIIEWSTPTAVDDAHRDDDVLAIWKRKAEMVEYIAPTELDGADVPFVSYEVIADL